MKTDYSKKETYQEIRERFFYAFALTLLAVPAFCQHRVPYKSKAEDEYMKKGVYEKFIPTNIDEVRAFRYPHVVDRPGVFNNKFISVWEEPEYFRKMDSLASLCDDALWSTFGEQMADWTMEQYFKYMDSLEALGMKPRRESSEYKEAERKCRGYRDSVEQLINNNKIAGISKRHITRYDSLPGLWIVLYEEFRLGALDGAYVVAVSKDHKRSWVKYFTGLIKNQFYCIKPDPKISLFKNDSTLQLEAAVVRQVLPQVLPVDPDIGKRYELVEDNRLLELKISDLSFDSDQDGLTDIYERWLSLDPASKDTDGDGLSDDIDSNPRYPKKNDINSWLFQYILDSAFHDSLFVSNKTKGDLKPISIHPNTYFIVTDDVDLQGLDQTKSRYIILSPAEFHQRKKTNPAHGRIVHVSPFFKVDGMPGTRKIKISFDNYGFECVVIEQKKGWLIKKINSWIV